MDLALENKVALVTGACRGIGKAIAIELATNGVDVLINGRDEKRVQLVVEEIKNNFPETNPKNAAGDITNEQDRIKLVEQFPNIDILVNNLGIYELMNYEDVTDEILEKYIKTNALSANSLTNLILPSMLAKNFGRILFIASEEAIMPSGQMPQYSVTKSMLLAFCKNISKHTALSEVTANTILPGPTLSENVYQIIDSLFDSDMEFTEKEATFVKSNLPQSELGRFIRPEEIGRTVAFLSSPYASAFRGAPIRMDGGLVPTIF